MDLVCEIYRGRTDRQVDDITAVLKKAFEMKQVVVIECPIDYSVNYEAFSKEIEDFTCEM